MLNNSCSVLRAKTNSNEVIGHPPGTLLVAYTSAGGGFAGAPQTICVWVRKEGWPEDLFPRSDFPPQSGRHDYIVYNELGVFYIEGHRLKYGWSIPVTEEGKKSSK